MEKIQLFTYGTLQDPRIQLKLFGKTLIGKPDTLMGFHQKQILLGAQYYPTLVQKDPQYSEEKITGTCYTLSQRDLTICDYYEGTAYQRIRVELVSKNTAWVYISNL